MRFAYIDPGTGSMLISATIAMISVAFFMIKGFIYRKFSLGGDKGEQIDLNKSYGLVFYSEGKQYWNVFMPLLEEASKRGIKVTYMTSGKDDPGLKSTYPDIESIYIGSGKESFYIMNRLRADVVVMTTPGLDVLELKRSKHVKHYSHITHAPGCMAGYKAFAVDYYDSVLLGGEGDIAVLRELEMKRQQEPKQIEVIGQPYLDVLRQKLETLEIEPFFENDKKTVLLSPTWSNHGLLMKHGDKLIQALEDADAYNVIIRPHPQSYISEQEMLDRLMKKFPNNASRRWDRSVENLNVLAQADIMISDFSGIIFDYFTLFKRPILTLKEQYEKRGRDVIDLDDDPWDIKMLSVIGKVITDTDIDGISNIIEDTLDGGFKVEALDQKTINILDKYPNEAAVRGMDFLETLIELREEKTEEVVAYSPSLLMQTILGMSLMTIYIYLGSHFLPEKGLNKAFLTYALPKAVLILLVMIAVYLIRAWFTQKGTTNFKKTKEPLELKDCFLLLVPMMPIVQYIISNQDIMNLSDTLSVLSMFTLLSLVVLLLIPYILSPLISKKVSMAISVSFFFVMFNMASFGRSFNILYILLILFGIPVVILFLFKFNKKHLVATVVLVLFVANTVPVVIDKFNSIDIYGALNKKNNLSFDPITKDLEIKKTPDIYLLTYDSYGHEETMLNYGVDNSDQVNYLLDSGFTVYDGTYSTGLYSLSSIGKVLSPEPQFYNLKALRTIVSGEAAGFIELRNHGYDMSIISQNDYMLKGVTSKYDYTFPDNKSTIKPSKIITNAVIEGEFSSDANFSKITYDQYLEANFKLLAQEKDNPRFIYKHGSRPGHTPNVGKLEPNALDNYKKRLKNGNDEMRKDIEIIKSHNKDAIIVIMGDHGPYLTKDGKDLSGYDPKDVTRHDVQDRFGTFLAISWPEENYARRYNIQTIQDLFPAFLSYIYQDDTLFEETKIEALSTSKTAMSGVYVKDGIIYGGYDDGKPLFENVGIRER